MINTSNILKDVIKRRKTGKYTWEEVYKGEPDTNEKPVEVIEINKDGN